MPGIEIERCERCGVQLVILEINGSLNWVEYDPIGNMLEKDLYSPTQRWYITLYLHTPIRCTNERIRKERGEE